MDNLKGFNAFRIIKSEFCKKRGKLIGWIKIVKNKLSPSPNPHMKRTCPTYEESCSSGLSLASSI